MPIWSRSIACLGFTSTVLLLLAGSTPSQNFPTGQNWTHYVRIGAYGLKTDNAEKIARNAVESNVFGIEVDNDIPGRYESFVNPEEKLQSDPGRG